MSEMPPDWFDALAVDPESVARVGYSLAAYAYDEELPRLDRENASDEDRLLVATTLTEAASLLAVVSSAEASERLAQAASLFEEARAPEAWVVGMACGGIWEPRRNGQGVAVIGRPSDAMCSLAALFARQEAQLESARSGWDAAIPFNDTPNVRWSALGAPSRLFAEFASAVDEGDVPRAETALDLIIDRSDETIRLAQEQDEWRWHNFQSAVPVIDPELLALGCLAARAEIAPRDTGNELSPARVAVLAGMRIGAGHHPDTDLLP